MLAVGTNNLKSTESDPTVAAQALYSKVRQYRHDLPNTRVILPGVLPTSDPVVNERVKTFNKHLSDICNNSHGNSMVNFVDTRVFCDRDGKLRTKFRSESDGELKLHLNPEGTRLLASRLKAVLREHHYLPTGPRFRPRPLNEGGASLPPRGGGRGSGRGSGGRERGSGAPRGQY